MRIFDYLIQILIIFSGIASAWLLGVRVYRVRRFGYIINILRQIPFAILFFRADQNLMFIAAIVYLFVWGYGLKNNWKD